MRPRRPLRAQKLSSVGVASWVNKKTVEVTSSTVFVPSRRLALWSNEAGAFAYYDRPAEDEFIRGISNVFRCDTGRHAVPRSVDLSEFAYESEHSAFWSFTLPTLSAAYDRLLDELRLEHNR
jgi:hypothetical protein